MIDLDERTATLTLSYRQLDGITSSLLHYATFWRGEAQKAEQKGHNGSVEKSIADHTDALFSDLFKHEKAIYDGWKADRDEQKARERIEGLQESLADASQDALDRIASILAEEGR